MTAEFMVGWLATTVAMLLSVPQIIRLVRTRSTDGLSLLMWQTMLVINLGWMVHGLLIGATNMVVTNIVGGATTVAIQVLIIRARRLRAWTVVVPGLIGAAVLVGIDLGLGAAAFGIASLVPAVLANTGQTVELVRSPLVTGVSPLFLIGQVVNQTLWFTWSLLAGDAGTMIAAPTTGAIAVLNVVWWALRKGGLRPLFVRPVPIAVAPAAAQVSCET